MSATEILIVCAVGVVGMLALRGVAANLRRHHEDEELCSSYLERDSGLGYVIRNFGEKGRVVYVMKDGTQLSYSRKRGEMMDAMTAIKIDKS